MSEDHLSGPSFMQRMFLRIGNPLEWQLIDRSMLAAGLLFLFAFQWLFVMRGLVADRASAPYFNPEITAIVVRVQTGFVLVWLGVLVLLGLFRKKLPENPFSAYLVAQLYALHTGLVSYAFGSQTSPYGMLFGIAGGVVGLLFLGFRPTIAGAITFSFVEYGSYLASSFGMLPYAPVMRSAPFADGRLWPSWALLTGSWVIAGQVTVLILCGYVIWRWRQREEQLREAHLLLQAQKDQLVRAESLAAVGSLVTGAAHELRNPLSSSGALFQSLKEDIAQTWGNPDAKEDALQTIDMALKGQRRAALIAEKLYQLTDDLVTHKSSISLGDSLDSLVRQYPGLEIDVATDLRARKIPEPLTETILPNLLDNAVAASGIQAPRLGITQTNGICSFTVSDSGRGIPRAIQGEVFKPFFTGQKAGEGHGVGLGLYIVHELVARMGGVVTLESEEGKGTKVTVEVPLAALAH